MDEIPIRNPIAKGKKRKRAKRYLPRLEQRKTRNQWPTLNPWLVRRPRPLGVTDTYFQVERPFIHSKRPY